jgi:hypothetical protein
MNVSTSINPATYRDKITVEHNGQILELTEIEADELRAELDGVLGPVSPFRDAARH